MLHEAQRHWERVAEEARYRRDLNQITVHEAAHCVLARLLGIEIEYVAIDPFDLSGYTAIRHFREASDRQRMIMLAAGLASAHMLGVTNGTRAGQDGQQRKELAEHITDSPAELWGLMDETLAEARQLVDANWPKITGLAACLAAFHKLSGREVDRALYGRKPAELTIRTANRAAPDPEPDDRQHRRQRKWHECLRKAGGNFDRAQEAFRRWLHEQGMAVDDLGGAGLTFRRGV